MTGTLESPTSQELTPDQLLDRLPHDETIREFEERVHDEFAGGDIPGFVHLYAGEEASAVGVCTHLRRPRRASPPPTAATATASPRASTSTAMMAEIYGKITGSCQGKGGSMHIADLSKGMLGANGIVGGGPPLICGARAGRPSTRRDGGVGGRVLRRRRLQPGHHPRVPQPGRRSGTCRPSSWRRTTATPRPTSSTWSVATDDIADRAAGVRHARRDRRRVRLLRRARGGRRGRRPGPATGGGPTLIEVKFTRYFGHFEGDQQSYRRRRGRPTPAKNLDCLKRFRGPRDRGRPAHRGPARRDRRRGRRRSIEEAVAEAKAAPEPGRRRPAHRRLRLVLIGGTAMARTSPTARRSTRRSPRRWSATQRSSSWARTTPAAQGAPARTDAWGGVLGVTKGLYHKFPGRVLDTPISESAFIGAAVGAATGGLRPVAELMFIDFMGVCFDQIFNQAAKFRYMFGGKAVTPVVDPHDVRRRAAGGGPAQPVAATRCSPTSPASRWSRRRTPTTPRACSSSPSATTTR